VDLILGVDGGNTKTIAVVARRDGTIMGWGRSGCGDIYGAVSEDAALGEIERAADEALTAARASRRDLLSSGMSLAGADWPEDIEFLREAMDARELGRNITVVNDGLGPLRAGVPQGPGIAATCGTGLAIGARGHEGETWHGSFWLESHGAREMSVSAFRRVIQAEIGIGPPTSLSQRVSQYYGGLCIEEILHRLTARSRTGEPPFAGLAPILLHEADAGDSTSRTIVKTHGKAIGEYVLAAARKVFLDGEPFPLVLAGGVFRHPSRLLERSILSRVRRECPGVHVVRTRFEPVVGALLFGFDTAGLRTDARIMSRMAATLPPDEVFAT